MARCGCGSNAVCSCLLVDGVGTTVTGTGSGTNPYQVNVATSCDDVRDCLSAGDGISYDSDTGVITADPVDCADVRPCISADAPAAYNPVTGVIDVDISGDPGNVLTQGGDGGLYAPAGMFAGAAVGCGLSGTGIVPNPLTPNVAMWPYTCPDTSGADVYCDTNGQLKTNPPIEAITAFVAFNETVNVPLTNSFDNIATTHGPLTNPTQVDPSITNPSNCNSALVITSFDFDADFNIPDGTSVELVFAGDTYWRYTNQDGVTVNDQHWQGTRVSFNILGPGATLANTVNMQARFTGAGPVSCNRVQIGVRNALITTHMP